MCISGQNNEKKNVMQRKYVAVDMRNRSIFMKLKKAIKLKITGRQRHCNKSK